MILPVFQTSVINEIVQKVFVPVLEIKPSFTVRLEQGLKTPH